MSTLSVDNIENLAGEERFGPITSAVFDATNGGADDLTVIDFTSIPSWVKRISILFMGVSTDGADQGLVQLGDSGGIEATNYIASTQALGASTGATTHTTGFGIRNTDATVTLNGIFTLALADPATNTWVASFILDSQSSSFAYTGGGKKILSGVLDRLRITTTGGTDLYDGGSVSIMYE